MPHSDGDSERRFERLRRSATRRQIMSSAIAASVGGLAGCSSGSDDGTPTGTDAGDGGDDGTDTPTATTAGDVGETATGTEEPTQTEPVADTVRSYMPIVPEQSFLYEYGASGSINNMGIGWVIELCLPFREGTTDFKSSGTTYDLGDRGEVEVMCWLDDWDINPPYEWTEHYDDRTTYWDGTPMDAEAHENHLRIGYYGEGSGRFSPGQPQWEVDDQWALTQWRATGDAEGVQANPANRFAIELNNLGSYLPPPHPDFTQQWADDLENASSAEEAGDLYTDLQSVAVTLFDFAENGWGSGLYEIPSVDDMSNEALQLQAREDHPNNRAETVPNVELQVADNDRQNILRNEGEIHLDETVISEESGEVNRGTIPDHIQQLSITGESAIFGTTFNWAGDLGNLWVRRAVIAAIDWPTISTNAFGPNGFIPLEHQTGLSDVIADTWFSQEFLDQLHQWPMASDLDAAEQYMQRAGYSRQGGTWVSPSGEEAGILGKTSGGYTPGYTTAMQSIKQRLDEFGLPMEFENQSTQAANESRDNMTYDLMYWWNNQRSPWEGYTTTDGWWNPKIVERDPDFPNSFDGWDDSLGGRSPDLEPIENENGEVQEADTEDLRSQPLQVQIPTEVGAIEAPDEAGRSPDLSGGGIDTREFNLIAHLEEMHTDPELTEERLSEILEDLAWYFNFYLPDFWPVTLTNGVVGNVRDFNWPPQGNEVLKTSARLGSKLMHQQSQGGLIFNKYDTEYQEP